MYQSFYNLTGKPFRLSPDPAFFFPSRGHKRALAYLRYGLHQNEGFVVITGAPGTGKTTLAQILLNEMGEKNVVVAHLTTTQLEADDMLRMVSASLGLRYENLDKAALLKGIESFLLTRSRENKRALLVIDEAQNLPMRSLEELRMLSNLQVGDKALLQTFLLGQVQFRSMLENEDLEQLRQRVIANFHLGPLAADESQRYIESRLRHVGWNEDPAFAEIAFEKIHEYTEGVPRRINMLCDRILLFGCMEEQHNVTGEVVDAVRAELEQEVGNTVNPAKPSAKSAGAATGSDNGKKNNSVKNTQQNASNEPAANRSAADKHVESTKSADKPVAANTQKHDDAVASGQRAKNVRAEPQFPKDLPIEIDSDSEQFIDITQDFIDKFDASITRAREAGYGNGARTEDTSAARRKPVMKPAQPKERQSTYVSKNKSHEDVRSKEKAAVPTNNGEDGKIDIRADEDVQGNTVKRKQLDLAQNGSDGSHIEVTTEPAQISERDLFRVIPGGKNNRNEQKTELPTEQIQNPAMSPAASASPSSEDVVLRRILRLVLAFHRSPSSFPGLDDPTQPLPEGVSELLELSVADDEVLTRVSPAAVMGISPVMLRAAVRFFIRRTLFANDKDHYRMLGLSNKASAGEIERHYDLLMRLLRQDKQPGAAECVDKVGRSYETLMRFDDAPQAQMKLEPKSGMPAQNGRQLSNSQSSDERAAAVLEALENPDLTIDFSENEAVNNYQPKSRPVSAFVGYGTEHYIPDPRITRRRIHLLGQAAVLGIGALVVVLGIFITQLEPGGSGDKTVNPDTVIANADGTPVDVPPVESKESRERRLGLSFNDGSSDALRESFPKAELIDEKPITVFEDKPKEAVNQTAKSNDIDEELDRVTAGTNVKVAKSEDLSMQNPEKPVNTKSPTTAIAATPKQDANTLMRTITSGEQAAGSKFQPVPVATKESPNNAASTQAANQQGKFTAVPIAAKPDIEQQTIADIARKDATQHVASNTVSTVKPATMDNQFPGKDLPISQAAPASQTNVIAAAPVTTPVTTPAITPAATLSPIEVALSDSNPEQDVVQASSSDPTQTTPADVTSGGSINEFHLGQLLKKFSSAYQTGDLNKLMDLFANDARTNTQTTRSGIEREYKSLFSSSASRSLSLIDPQWINEGRFARGVGQFSISIVPQGGEAYTTKGKYTLQAYLDGNNVVITRFYFSNEVTTTRNATQTGSPTQSELKDLLTGFTRYYEGGQLDELMVLFSAKAQTNDQNTLAGIRKDHEDLFNSTVQRQIFLKEIKWQVSGKTATGNGNFEVMVQNKGQDSFASVTGTITIEAEKSDNGLKITRFLHKVK